MYHSVIPEFAIDGVRHPFRIPNKIADDFNVLFIGVSGIRTPQKCLKNRMLNLRYLLSDTLLDI